MTTFYKLVKIEDTPEFIAAAKSMGWDETNYEEILEDLENQDGYIVNCDEEIQKVKNANTSKATLYVTIGGDGGNRWYDNEVPVLINDLGMWCSEDVIESCC